MIDQETLDLIKKKSSFFDSSFHGVKHWQTVERNGHYLANFNGADKVVLSYFAYFHDCMRENEGRDKGHGPRAAVFAMKHRDLTMCSLSSLQTLVRGILTAHAQNVSLLTLVGMRIGLILVGWGLIQMPNICMMLRPSVLLMSLIFQS